VLTSTSKIYGVGDDVQDLEITSLIRSSFPEGARITLTQLLKYHFLLIFAGGQPRQRR